MLTHDMLYEMIISMTGVLHLQSSSTDTDTSSARWSPGSCLVFFSSGLLFRSSLRAAVDRGWSFILSIVCFPKQFPITAMGVLALPSAHAWRCPLSPNQHERNFVGRQTSRKSGHMGTCAQAQMKFGRHIWPFSDKLASMCRIYSQIRSILI